MADIKKIVQPSGLLQWFRDLGGLAYAERVIAGLTVTPSATFQRPNDTTAYAVGDLVANDTVVGNVAPMAVAVGAGGRSLQMLRVRLSKTDPTVANAAFRVHLFATAPVAAAGDNAPISTSKAADYLGAFDVTSMMAFSDGAAGVGALIGGTSIGVALAADNVYALLEARGAYVPVAHETFTLTVEAVQD